MRSTQYLIMGGLLCMSLSACEKQMAPTAISSPVEAAQDAGERVAESVSWRGVATDQDRGRIRNWYKSWQAAISDARAKGDGPKIDAQGALLSPTSAIDEPKLAEGEYRCRVLKLGAKGRATLGFSVGDWGLCRVDGSADDRTFVKLDGVQRPSGRLYHDGFSREIFLGTLSLSDEQASIPYGSDRMRDMAGIVERISDERWRIVLPEPAYESLLDVIELAPVISSN